MIATRIPPARNTRNAATWMSKVAVSCARTHPGAQIDEAGFSSFFARVKHQFLDGCCKSAPRVGGDDRLGDAVTFGHEASAQTALAGGPINYRVGENQTDADTNVGQDRVSYSTRAKSTTVGWLVYSRHVDHRCSITESPLVGVRSSPIGLFANPQVVSVKLQS
jgi:hypothetical protein